MLPFDHLFAGYDPSAHLSEDLFKSKIAFVVTSPSLRPRTPHITWVLPSILKGEPFTALTALDT